MTDEREGSGGVGVPEERLGDRVRALRKAAGLTQTELAAGRWTKEYVSQVERGKTSPGPATVSWLAERLGTDVAYLESGVAGDERRRLDERLAAADALLAAHRYAEAGEAYRSAGEIAAGRVPPAELRALCGAAWAEIRRGRLDAAGKALDRAAELVTRPGFTDLDRSDVLFRLGVLRYTAAEILEAIGAFDAALRLAGPAGGSDRLRSDCFQWRSRCYRRARDWEAAREDVERALELAAGGGDLRREADALFQASLVSERQGQWVRARSQALRSKELFAELGDRATVARLLNNLAGLEHLLGRSEQAAGLLREAFAVFVELDLRAEAGYTLTSLAEIHLDRADAAEAERAVREALELLGDRADHLAEIGTAQLVLGRALASLGRVDEAEEQLAASLATFERAASVGHQAVTWIAQGDTADLRGDVREASRLYRQAAVALQPAPS
jgi:tetratricopeptide (TPR) repeat protein